MNKEHKIYDNNNKCIFNMTLPSSRSNKTHKIGKVCIEKIIYCQIEIFLSVGVGNIIGAMQSGIYLYHLYIKFEIGQYLICGDVDSCCLIAFYNNN